jgi:beta-glucosidase/6-phospho-beta-glucosidase/beta-galactosidase
LGNLTSAKGYGAMLKVVHFHANLVVHFGRDRTARLKYLEEDIKLGELYQQIQNSKPVDRVREDQFAIENDKIFRKRTELNKKIFGKYFASVRIFHREFEESIQVYSRDMPIGLDNGFDD